MQLGHLLTRSGLTYPEVFSKVYHDSFCQLDSSISLPWVISFDAFYLHVVSSFSCIPLICPKLVLFLAPLQFVHSFCNLSKCPNFFTNNLIVLPSKMMYVCVLHPSVHAACPYHPCCFGDSFNVLFMYRVLLSLLLSCTNPIFGIFLPKKEPVSKISSYG